MKCFVSMMCLCLVLSANALGRYDPLESLIEKSPIIVVASLENHKVSSKGDRDYESGNLIIYEVLKGDVKANQKLNLTWSNKKTVACPRIRFDNDVKSLWFIKLCCSSGN